MALDLAIVQQSVCRGRSWKGRLKPPSVCMTCENKGDMELCRFKGFRVLGGPADEFAYHEGVAPSDPIYRTHFQSHKTINTEKIHVMKAKLLPYIEELVRVQMKHEERKNLIRKNQEVSARTICDICNTCILSGSFMCKVCAHEICLNCFEDPNEPLQDTCPSATPGGTGPHMYLPVSRFSKGHLSVVVKSLEDFRAKKIEIPEKRTSDKTTRLVNSAQAPFRDIPVLSRQEKDEFEYLWSRGIPILIGRTILQGDWSPERFCSTHGTELVHVVDSTKAGTVKTTLTQFLRSFSDMSPGDEKSIKLKDYPPTTSFRAKFEEYDSHFQVGVPMSSFAAADGFENLAAHFPYPSPAAIKTTAAYIRKKPDLGPKMYFASTDTASEGTTRLHVDMASAVNCMAWTKPGATLGLGKRTRDLSDDPQTGAHWMVFAPEDAGKLSTYLRTRLGLSDTDVDPIHAQQTFITQTVLSELAGIGIYPYVFYQNADQAVFIPAGSAHQVSNRSACIKIATDFVCVEQLAATLRVAQEVRRNKFTDVLHVQAVIWHAWTSLTNLQEMKERQAANATSASLRVNPFQLARRARQRSRKQPPREGTQYYCPDPVCKTVTRNLTFDGVLCHIQETHIRSVTREELKSVFMAGTSREEQSDRYSQLYGIKRQKQ